MQLTQDSRSVYARIAKLTIPIALQNLMNAAVSSADVVMLNFVGQAHISAVSLAAQYASILFSVLYGLGTGATILCSQYYGKGDLRAIDVVQGISLRLSLTVSGVFALGALTVPHLMMRVYTPDPELIEIGQVVAVISEGKAYNSMLTGRQVEDTTLLIFGSIRLDLTKRI